MESARMHDSVESVEGKGLLDGLWVRD